MTISTRYGDKKDIIRDELRRCAAQGTTIFYAELGQAVGVPVRGPWRAVLDLISNEEVTAGLPDVTYLVIQKSTGLSGRIMFKDAKRPTPQQIKASEEVQRHAWRKYRPESRACLM